ncbi:dihydroxyacetone kinase Dak1 [Wallemia mellicola]|uniref:Galactose-1-phosphate uridylyltransferase n=1 Tax=Wallemia mellicola TaxID=1708541 RepID=A0AB74KBR3_9BASI|nr:dihydroxyacetone kinase Dak1 [Wallemia mellicola]
MPDLQQQPLSDNQSTRLPTERTTSSIPRPQGKSTSEGYGEGTHWEYPSPQQFYNALVRKGWETPEESVEDMVAIHNFLNEEAWKEVLKWEKRNNDGKETLQLAQFSGRPGDYTPKARLQMLLSTLFSNSFYDEPPFDRHDWYIKRTNSNETVRYVIDYYGAPPTPEGMPVFHLDVRPALDSPASILERIKVVTFIMSATNKHINDSSETAVLEALHGLCRLNPQLTLDRESKAVYNSNFDKSKVSLIAGGGSGHEPSHSAFVGEGMLNAAVPGTIFASPNTAQILRGIQLASSPLGTLVIVKNYTGDVLHFGLAKEKFAAKNPEAARVTRFIMASDDVSVGREQSGIVGRRGLAGVTLIHKLAGAMAHKGGNIDQVEAIANYVNDHTATLGAGLEHTHVPGTEASQAYLKDNELEIGMGIHNEPGFTKVSPIPPASKLIENMVETLTSTSDPDRSYVNFKNDGTDRVVLMVNNLGGLSELEIAGATGHATSIVQKKGYKVERVLSGTFITSLNMPGFSLTLLKLPADAEKAPATENQLLDLLDLPVNAPGWRWHAAVPPRTEDEYTNDAQTGLTKSSTDTTSPIKTENGDKIVKAIQSAAENLIKAEPEITRLDTIAGDGDCGLTLKAGAEGVLNRIKEGQIGGEDIAKYILEISEVAETDMGGTSGALYSIFFSALAGAIREHKSDIQKASKSALDTLYRYTRARPPSRTLIDPLDAFINAFAGIGDAKKAIEAANQATEEGKKLEAKAGRAAYVGQEGLKEQAVPDPGQVEAPSKPDLPVYDPKCYLCPGNERSNGGSNPKYDSTYYFVNDFSAVYPQNVETPAEPHPLIKTSPISGRCYVVCFHPNHNRTIAQMETKDVFNVVKIWCDLYSFIPEDEPSVKYIQIFENKGSAMGCSNPHPHGQIWSVSYIPEEPARALEMQGKYAKNTVATSSTKVSHLTGSPNMLLDYAAFELDKKERVVCSNDDFVAVVPYWAVWPFETLVIPTKKHIPSVAYLNETEQGSLAAILREVACRYDNIFDTSFPYSMGLTQQPIKKEGDADWDSNWDDAQLHIHFYPPLLRSASVRKFLVGFELLGEPQRDLTAEGAAQRIRDSDPTYPRWAKQ